MKKYIAPTRLGGYVSPHEFSPRIGRGQLSGIFGKPVVGKRYGRSRKKFGMGIGEVSGVPTVRFEDDLTAGLVEEWNREVDEVRASLG